MPGGALAVPGADKDMDRLAAMIMLNGEKIDQILVSMDSHYHYQIFHSAWWVNVNGQHPKPFTIITEEDVQGGVWMADDSSKQDWALYYIKTLKEHHKYSLCIWPDHTILGSPGHAIYPRLLDAINIWEEKKHRTADRLMKGMNEFTEHYSIIQADVFRDVTTQPGMELIAWLARFNSILVAGEARSHCVASSVRDLIEGCVDPDYLTKFASGYIGIRVDPKNITLLEDATSDVPGFEQLGADFVESMVSKGMKLGTTLILG
jgi:nicotinamidase-related amidase